MPKVKSKRQKLHSKAAKACKKTNEDIEMQEGGQMNDPSSSSSVGGGIFSKLNIDLDALQKQLNPDGPDFDARSGVTSKSLRGLNLKKKDKMKLRHEIWMKKMDIVQETKKEQKAKKRRSQTAIVGDMKPLEDTLPTLDLLLRETQKQFQSDDADNKRESVKRKGIKKEKTKHKEMMADISLFGKVINHPAYQENPSQTITEHLSNKLKQEDKMDS